MPRSKPAPSKMSSNPKTATGGKAGGGRTGEPARAQRDDTTEARQQKERMPKTHPNRNADSIPARRKDK